jgi:prophage antirepressor-like protein
VTANNIVPFDFEGNSIRVISRDGEPWWVLADVCRVLEIANSRQAASRLDDDEKGVITSDTLGGDQMMGIVNESGLYSLILTSRKIMAKRFKKWVTAEVLPSIRKTGSFTVAPESDEITLSRALLLAAGKLDEAKQQIALLEPKAVALDRIATADGELTITEAAKALGLQPKVLFMSMQAKAWIYKRAGGKNWLGYQNRVQAGLLTHKVSTVSRSDGSEKIVEQVLVTPKGLTRLAELGAAH